MKERPTVRVIIHMRIFYHIITYFVRVSYICISYDMILDFSIFLCFYYNLNLYVIIHLIYFLHMYANLRNRCKPHPLYSFLPFSFNLFKTLFFFFFYIKFINSIIITNFGILSKRKKKIFISGIWIYAKMSWFWTFYVHQIRKKSIKPINMLDTI